MFSSHYLKTSLILPKLFIEAKLEWLVKDATRDSDSIVGGWDMQKLQDEVPIISGDSIVGVLK